MMTIPTSARCQVQWPKELSSWQKITLTCKGPKLACFRVGESLNLVAKESPASSEKTQTGKKKKDATSLGSSEVTQPVKKARVKAQAAPKSLIIK